MEQAEYWRGWIKDFCGDTAAKHYGDSMNDQYVFGHGRHITMNDLMLNVADGSLWVSLFFRDIAGINRGVHQDGRPFMEIRAGASIAFTV